MCVCVCVYSCHLQEMQWATSVMGRGALLLFVLGRSQKPAYIPQPQQIFDDKVPSFKGPCRHYIHSIPPIWQTIEPGRRTPQKRQELSSNSSISTKKEFHPGCQEREIWLLCSCLPKCLFLASRCLESQRELTALFPEFNIYASV